MSDIFLIPGIDYLYSQYFFLIRNKSITLISKNQLFVLLICSIVFLSSVVLFSAVANRVISSLHSVDFLFSSSEFLVRDKPSAPRRPLLLP